MNTRCPRCDAAFECSPAGRACWCTELPPLPIAKDIAGATCLCRKCLEERVKAESVARFTPSGRYSTRSR